MFVHRLCAAWGVPLAVRREAVGRVAAERSLGVEEAGRAVRYAFLEEEAGRLEREGGGAVKIATAHTLSDSMETALLSMTRGCGPGRIAGRSSGAGTHRATADRLYPGRGGGVLCRPGTGICHRQHQQRLPVFPQPGTGTGWCQSCTGSIPGRRMPLPGCSFCCGGMKPIWKARQRSYTGGYAGRMACWPHRSSKLPPPCAAVCCGALRCSTGAAANFRLVEEMEGLLNGQCRGVNLPEGRTVRLRDGRLCVDRAAVHEDRSEKQQLDPGDSFVFEGRVWRTWLLSGEEYARLMGHCREKLKKIYKIVLTNTLNYDMITTSIFIRSRLPGDRLHPAGRGVGKSLKKLYNEARIPEQRRRELPILCDAQGILLVPGVAADQRVRVTRADAPGAAGDGGILAAFWRRIKIRLIF